MVDRHNVLFEIQPETCFVVPHPCEPGVVGVGGTFQAFLHAAFCLTWWPTDDVRWTTTPPQFLFHFVPPGGRFLSFWSHLFIYLFASLHSFDLVCSMVCQEKDSHDKHKRKMLSTTKWLSLFLSHTNRARRSRRWMLTVCETGLSPHFLLCVSQ